MGLKYYLPENHKNLAACEGFYIDNKAFFGCEEPDDDQWNGAVTNFSTKIHCFVPGLQIVNDWESFMGISRMVLLKSYSVQVIMGDDDRYVSIFVIIPENYECSKSAMQEYENVLFTIHNYLTRKYPDKVFKRKNTWELKPLTLIVKGKKGYGGLYACG